MSGNRTLSLGSMDNALERQREIVGCQNKLRAAAFEAITEDDIRKIVQGQVEKAKTGDSAAIKFVFSQLLGNGQGTVFKQTNIVTDVETAARIAKEQGSSR